jgi:membrane protein DedA with SNARE-associated domain
VIGALVGWAIGAYGGRPFLERYGRYFHLHAPKVDRAERWFERWGAWAVFLGRITPVVRSFISIPAGVFRWPLVPYAALTAAGSAIWCFAFAGAGWGLGRSWAHVHHDFRYVDYGVVVLVVATAAAILVRRRSRKLARRVEDPAG